MSTRRRPYGSSVMGPKQVGIPHHKPVTYGGGGPLSGVIGPQRTSGIPGKPPVTTNANAVVNPTPQLPPDPYLDLLKDQGQRQVGLADANAAYQSGRLQSDYGYDASGNVDPTDPYSRAMTLQDEWHKSQRGLLNSAGNQLYSGSYQNAQDESTRRYHMSDDALRKQYTDAQANVALGQLGTYANTVSGVDQATFQALLNALKVK